ncbi:phosphatidate cytidylyltransferase [Sphingorhabdus sp. IMCC26285]|uniref:Phosphatidate cytidylyltransferase n=1 Tax=Sphingorhabdus profundilacus TaxID=2509718 RepID=A0A6I4LUC9_9SPHN|nr:phosphatidate cytidylyltransferase [Sphingorhabdus profundilacus]MVZ97022.1 phosphatidate cytidylyltransferase [Sphingorhabdus profundilacus]
MNDNSAPLAKPRSDLGIRTASGVVMMLVAAGAIWLGGPIFALFTAAITVGLLFEWTRLVLKLSSGIIGKLVWIFAGLVYIGVATAFLVFLREFAEIYILLGIIGVVIATDTGAYFAGRAFGGPKIAPAISPSKTWSGLCGGMAMAALFLGIEGHFTEGFALWQPLLGAGLAIVAQAGDFFESWMKRRAGVKDSGTLIPGHGGLFDRADGLVAVLCATALLVLFLQITGQW